jgi:streptogramin lyase
VRRVFGVCAAVGLAAAAFVLPPAASAASLSEFDVAAGPGALGAITAARDGRLWIADGAGVLRRMTTGGTERPPLGLPAGNALDLLDGEENGLWVLVDDGTLARVDLSSTHAFVGGNVPTEATQPQALALGQDSRVWFADSARAIVGATEAGFAFDETDIGAGSMPTDLAAGSDGQMWVTASGSDEIVRMQPTPFGTDPLVTARVPVGAGSEPYAIAAGADGALWFTERAGNKIGRVTTAGMLTEFAIPTPNSSPHGIALGPDGAIWFVERAGNKVARISPGGTIVEYPLPTAAAEPVAITAGPDGAMWFTEAAARRVGRVTTEPDGGAPGPRGDPGADGSDGAAGTDGASGRDGADGADGADGQPGARGSKGDAGARGDAGAPGANGESGAGGPAGERGQDGTLPLRTPLRASCRIARRAAVGARQRITVTCSVRGADRGRAVLRWQLALGKRTVARGLRTTRASRATFVLPLVARPAKGRYQLSIAPQRPAPPTVRLGL